MICRFALIFWLVLSKILLFGQTQYNLTDCYRIGLENNIDVKKAQNEISLNAIDRKTAQFSLLPSLSYSLEHYFSFGKNIDPVTNDFVFERFSGGGTGVDLQLELFTGLKKLNTIKQSTYNLRAAEFAKKRVELNLLSAITLAYSRILFNKEQSAVERNNIRTTTKELEIIKEKIKNGRLTKYEYYTFNARLNSEKA